jgi:hypothetical protein
MNQSGQIFTQCLTRLSQSRPTSIETAIPDLAPAILDFVSGSPEWEDRLIVGSGGVLVGCGDEALHGLRRWLAFQCVVKAGTKGGFYKEAYSISDVSPGKDEDYTVR